MAIELQSFLGTGWAFPPSFDKSRKQVRMVSDEEDIKESLYIILSTTPGERLMQPEFGCNLKKFVFEKTNASLMSNLTHAIYHALLNFEPRVNFIDIELLNSDELNGILHIKVNYDVIITNTRHNIVFPFYLLEGTNISDK